MKVVSRILTIGLLSLGLTIASSTVSFGQCAMCSLNAENSTQHGNTQGKGLNNGILFLLGAPFLIGAGVGILWYKKYRTKSPRPAVLSRH